MKHIRLKNIPFAVWIFSVSVSLLVCGCKDSSKDEDARRAAWRPADKAQELPYKKYISEPIAYMNAQDLQKPMSELNTDHRPIANAARRPMSPVRFYGKVVDENGHGIPGVRIWAKALRHYKCANGMYVLAHEKFSVRSDASGFFEISGFDADALAIDRFKRELYRPAELLSGAWWSTVPESAKSRPGATREDPMIFRMRPDSGEYLSINHIYANFSLPLDGTVRNINFDKPDRSNPTGAVCVTADMGGGGFMENFEDLKGPVNFTLTVGDGGALRMSEPLLCDAPETGYKRSITIPVDIGEMRKKKLLFYVCRGDPAYYAIMEFTFTPTFVLASNGLQALLDVRCIVTAAASGSRFLVTSNHISSDWNARKSFESSPVDSAKNSQ